jgi:hypothetical protein
VLSKKKSGKSAKLAGILLNLPPSKPLKNLQVWVQQARVQHPPVYY